MVGLGTIVTGTIKLNDTADFPNLVFEYIDCGGFGN